MHYDIFLFSVQKESISTGCRKKMFSAIYIHFKTLLYTNLILISMNNIFVDLLHIKPKLHGHELGDTQLKAMHT